MQFIFFLIKRIVMAICMIYTFDLIIMSVGILIPINIYSILLVAFLGLPAIFGFLILAKFI